MDRLALKKLAKLARYWILQSTTQAGSGHPTTALSAVELMIALMFGGVFRFNPDQPDYLNNDRLIFSKGHAAPLFYALWAMAGKISKDELMALRKFDSRLEGHPTLAFPYTEAATGSLGQGLSIGVGMALNAKYIDKLSYRTYALIGDSEMSEGSVWEAIQIASYYKLDNLVGVLDVNRLGQRGETMYGHNLGAYQNRIAAFGWKTILVDGHSFEEILAAYEQAQSAEGKPIMIIAKTLKGKGVSFLENKDGWHGKPLSVDELKIALEEIGEVDQGIRGEIVKPESAEISNFQFPISNKNSNDKLQMPEYSFGKSVATRQAYGNGLVKIFSQFPNIVALDAETSNSTGADIFKKAYPERFFEMFIAEQNMVGAALGFARRGKIPFVSTFSAFLTRAFDQIRMSQYSDANIKFVGSHAGVSIGQDGPSQMGLEDLAMFRTLLGSVVLYPSDAIATEKLVEQAARHYGIVYIRTTRQALPILYPADEDFVIGGSKVIKKSQYDKFTVVGAGITLYEALKAYEELKAQGIFIRIIDLYSVKPIDIKTIQQAVQETKAIITVEDHFAEGGIGSAVNSALSEQGAKVYSLAVRKMPKSGQPEELLDYEEISKQAIINKVKELYARETI